MIIKSLRTATKPRTSRPKTLLLQTACACAGLSIFVGAAWAYSANSWYPHPDITYQWHCGPTSDFPIFSAQSCVITYGNGTLQPAVVVRNRDGSAAHWASAIINTEGSQYACTRSGVGADDYSVCFGGIINSSGSTTVEATVTTPYSRSTVPAWTYAAPGRPL